MLYQGLLRLAKSFLWMSFALFPLKLSASFIESTIGTAVVNDATATYYNPAALTLLKNTQVITQGSVAYFHTQFSGQTLQTATGFTQSGQSSANTHYYLPSFYLGVPIDNKVTVGLAVISNFFNRDIDGNSILRYVQSSNSIQDVDLVPAVGYKINEYVAVGAGLNFSYASFLLQPTSGFPNLNIPDSQSRNDSNGYSWGGDVGLLIKPLPTTFIGLNYRSSMTYRLSGTSILEGSPSLVSRNYNFKFWTPARTVLSMNHFVTSKLGFISTIQWIQWDIFKTLNINGIAAQVGPRAVIIPSAQVPYYLHNSWVVTLGSHYRVIPKWVVRVAGTYIQSPANGQFQIANGDSIVLGASTAYEFSKWFIVDASYAHAFIQDQNINITTGRNLITGVNQGARDSVSVKFTFNIT